MSQDTIAPSNPEVISGRPSSRYVMPRENHHQPVAGSFHDLAARQGHRTTKDHKQVTP
jgi:hypothetical protein